MILTCPECATGYFVDDAKIGPAGRTVRCKHCGAQWRAHVDTPLDLEHDPADEATLAPSKEPALSLTEAQAEPAAKDLPKVYRERVRSERQIRQAAVAGIVWAGLAAVVALMIGAAVIFRVDMVRLWPRTAAAYAAVGLTVNPIGLVIEQVHAEPALRNGHAALAITGVIRNIEDRAILAPPLRITLLNSDGRTIGGKLAVPTNARIPPGGVRHFAVAVLDPPGSTANLVLTFTQRQLLLPRTVQRLTRVHRRQQRLTGASQMQRHALGTLQRQRSCLSRRTVRHQLGIGSDVDDVKRARRRRRSNKLVVVYRTDPHIVLARR